jgi:hypothetical protein
MLADVNNHPPRRDARRLPHLAKTLRSRARHNLDRSNCLQVELYRPCMYICLRDFGFVYYERTAQGDCEYGEGDCEYGEEMTFTGGREYGEGDCEYGEGDCEYGERGSITIGHLPDQTKENPRKYISLLAVHKKLRHHIHYDFPRAEKEKSAKMKYSVPPRSCSAPLEASTTMRLRWS